MKQEKYFTSPEEGLNLLNQAEETYGSFEKIPEVNFSIQVDPRRYRTKLKSIRLSEYIIEEFDELAQIYNMKPQTLMKAVLEEFVQKNIPSKHA